MTPPSHKDIERQLLRQKFGPPVLLDRALTEDEFTLLHATKDAYWLAFSQLVEDTLAKVPAELHSYLESMLQESSSVYGRKSK